MVIMGKHFVPAGFNVKSYKETAKLCRKPLSNSRWRVFHARRNNEMLQAVSLKFLFGAKIKIVFTSTAQRYPSWITRWLIRHTDGLITTSNIAAKYLPRKPDAIIPHGVDSIPVSTSRRIQRGCLEITQSWWGVWSGDLW